GEEDAPERPVSGSASRKRPTMPAVKAQTLRPATERNVPDPAPDNVNQPILVESDPVVGEDDRETTTPSPAAVPSARGASDSRAGATPDAELRSIPVADIHPNPRQPREVFDEDAMDELVASIREVG